MKEMREAGIKSKGERYWKAEKESLEDCGEGKGFEGSVREG